MEYIDTSGFGLTSVSVQNLKAATKKMLLEEGAITASHNQVMGEQAI